MQQQTEVPIAATGLEIAEIPQSPARVRRERPRRECPICYGEHNQETHDATLSVHGWFRAEVTKYLN